jgi:DNA-binding MarR family transcriptional regulator
VAWQAMRARIDDAIRVAGYTDVSHAHLTLFRWRSIDGMRPTELADEVWLSKQALNDLLRDLEGWGYVRLEVNPNDRRSRIIRLTAKGRRLYEEGLEAARQVECDLQDTLGPKRFATFRDTLMEVVRLANARERADGPIRGSATLSARR